MTETESPGPSPCALTAETVNTYDTPFANHVKIIGLFVPVFTNNHVCDLIV